MNTTAYNHEVIILGVGLCRSGMINALIDGKFDLKRTSSEDRLYVDRRGVDFQGA